MKIENRRQLINSFIQARNFKSYLEVGVDNHWNFDHIVVENKESVDPNPKAIPTYCMTSDEFWKTSENRYDIIFIDGLHQGDQVYRDIEGALSHLSREDSIVVLHDCDPENCIVGAHDYLVDGPWQGDVWTGFTYYRLFSPLYCYTVRPEDDCLCGIVDLSRKRQNVHVSSFIENLYKALTPETVHYLSYAVLTDYREELLGTITLEEFQTKIQKEK